MIMTRLQQRVWRWHFYAGLLVVPLAIMLAITGTIYVFKPQIDQWNYQQLDSKISVSDITTRLPAGELVLLAEQAVANSAFKRYHLPSSNANIVNIEVAVQRVSHTVWLNRYTGEVVETYESSSGLLNTVKKLHSELLVGDYGSYVVELAASWMIVLLVSGIYLWWPRPETNQSWLNTLQPALFPSIKGKTSRKFWQQLHGAIGIWFSLLILVFLVTGLPWTQLWGAGFDRVEKAFNWQGPGQEWRITLESSNQPKDDGLKLWSTNTDEGEVGLHSSSTGESAEGISLQNVLDKPELLSLVLPAQVQPPKGQNGVWTIRSMAQYRPDRVTIHFDKWTGDELMRISFNDYPAVKQVVSYGIALHEGALFGIANQILAALIASSVVLLSVSGTIMWWKRRPKGKLAAPKKQTNTRLNMGLMLITFMLAAFLPMLAISLCVLILVEGSYEFVRKKMLSA